MWLAVVLGALSLVGAVASALVWRHEARAACLAHEQCATSISEAVRDREALIREQRQLREMIEGLQRGLDEARSSASAQPQQVPGEMARLFRAAQDQLVLKQAS